MCRYRDGCTTVTRDSLVNTWCSHKSGGGGHMGNGTVHVISQSRAEAEMRYGDSQVSSVLFSDAHSKYVCRICVFVQRPSEVCHLA